MELRVLRPSAPTWIDLRPESAALFQILSGEPADRYIAAALFPPLGRLCRTAAERKSIAEALLDPYFCLRALLGHYAFNRRGRERGCLSELAVVALRRTVAPEGFDRYLERCDAVDLWENFVAVCREEGQKPVEQAHRSVVSGFLELAQDLRQDGGSGSLAAWLAESVERTGRLEPNFLRLVEMRGVGPKAASQILRDVVFLFDLEERLDPADRLYLQPIDKWTRAAAPYVIDEPNANDLPDWILAGKLAKYARRAGVSGVRFNMGIRWFGSREVRAPEFFDAAIRERLNASPNPSRASVDLR